MLRELLGPKVDDLKFKTAKGLSTALGRFLALALLVGIGTVLLLVVAFGAILLLGEAVDSYALAALIVAGVLLLVFGVVFLLRKRLFQDGFVRLFTDLLSDEKDSAEVSAIKGMRDLDMAIALNEKAARRSSPQGSGALWRNLLLGGVRFLQRCLKR